MNSQKLIYDKFWKSTFGPCHVPKLQSIRRMISGVKHCDTILDVGCGDGLVSLEIKRLLNGTVVGIDVSKQCLIKAAKRVDHRVLCDLEMNLPFKDGVFDLCAEIDVIEHVTDTDKLLREVYRILRPAGYFIVSTPNLASFFERIILLLGFQPQNVEVSRYHKFGSVKRSPPVGHLKAFTLNALKEILAFYRFEITKVIATTYLTGISKHIDVTLGKISKSLGSLVIVLARKTGRLAPKQRYLGFNGGPKEDSRADARPLVSVVIPSYNRKDKLIELMESIMRSDYPPEKLEMVVVSDASTDGTYETIIDLYPKAKVVQTENEVFPSKTRDLGARLASGQYLFFVDDDCVVFPNAISNLVRVVLSIGDKAGIVGPVLTCAENPSKVWGAGASLSTNSIHDVAHRYKGANLSGFIRDHRLSDISYSPSAYLMKKSVYLAVGGFNYRDFPLGWEEIDLATRVRNNGYRNVCANDAVVIHEMELGGKARNPARAYHHGKSRMIFYRRYIKPKVFLAPIYIIGFSIRNRNIDLVFSYLHGVIDGLTARLNLSKGSVNSIPLK